MNAQLQRVPGTDFQLLIGGKLVEGAATFNVINPATEQVLAVCPRADLAQVNEAVAAARAAFPTWAADQDYQYRQKRRAIVALGP